MICDDVSMANSKNESSLQDDWLSCSDEIPFSLQLGNTLISSPATSQAQYMVHVHGTLTNIVVASNFDTGLSVPCSKTLINPTSSFVSNEEIDKSVHIVKKFWGDLSKVEQEEAAHKYTLCKYTLNSFETDKDFTPYVSKRKKKRETCLEVLRKHG